jgi:predicted cobalt transporter CbtA
LSIAEPVLDRAVAIEQDHHVAAAVPEPFSRVGQRGGLVVGELVLATGVAFLLAGTAILLRPRNVSERRLWLFMTGAGIWAVVVVPAIVYPPLPPGVETSLSIGERQLLYLAAVSVGIVGFAATSRLWRAASGRARYAAPLVAIVIAALGLTLLPDRGTDTGDLPPGLLSDFRVVSIVGQLIFWTTLAVVGAVLLDRRLRLR